MILTLSGTKEGTEIISKLAQKGYKVCALTATAHGTKMVSDIPGVEVTNGSFNKDGFKKLCFKKKFCAIIDATHPLPNKISKTAREFCMRHDVPYIRFLREELELPENPLINPVYSWEEAVCKATKFGDTIFLTTGSNNLEIFLSSEYVEGKRVVVRVLPDYKIIEKCQSLGLNPKDIVAMQGPFSKEMNRAQFKMYNASVIVTKDSGKVGGTDTKISAALSMKIPVIVIKRKGPKNKYEVTNCETIFKIIDEICPV